MHYHFLLLWRLLSCLPPSVEYLQLLKNNDVSMEGSYILHTLRWAPRLAHKSYSMWIQVSQSMALPGHDTNSVNNNYFSFHLSSIKRLKCRDSWSKNCNKCIQVNSYVMILFSCHPLGLFTETRVDF